MNNERNNRKREIHIRRNKEKQKPKERNKGQPYRRQIETYIDKKRNKGRRTEMRKGTKNATAE